MTVGCCGCQSLRSVMIVITCRKGAVIISLWLRPGTSAEELPCSRGAIALANQRRRLLLPSNWPVFGDFYWTYKQDIPDSHVLSGFCFCFFAVKSTKGPRPAPTHRSPASCSRMYVYPACLYCPLLVPPNPPIPPGPLPTRPLLSAMSFTFRCITRPGWLNSRAAPYSLRDPRRQGSTRG